MNFFEGVLSLSNTEVELKKGVAYKKADHEAIFIYFKYLYTFYYFFFITFSFFAF